MDGLLDLRNFNLLHANIVPTGFHIGRAIARRAMNVLAKDADGPSSRQRSGLFEDAGSPQGYERRAQRSSHVCRSGIDSHVEVEPADEGRQLEQGKLAGQIQARDSGALGDELRHGTVVNRPGQDDLGACAFG